MRLTTSASFLWTSSRWRSGPGHHAHCVRSSVVVWWGFVALVFHPLIARCGFVLVLAVWRGLRCPQGSAAVAVRGTQPRQGSPAADGFRRFLFSEKERGREGGRELWPFASFSSMCACVCVARAPKRARPFCVSVLYLGRRPSSRCGWAYLLCESGKSSTRIIALL